LWHTTTLPFSKKNFVTNLFYHNIEGIARNMEHIPGGSLSFATRNLSAGTCIELQKLNHRKKGGPINNEILTEDHFTHKLISHLLLVPDYHHHERRAIHAGAVYPHMTCT